MRYKGLSSLRPTRISARNLFWMDGSMHFASTTSNYDAAVLPSRERILDLCASHLVPAVSVAAEPPIPATEQIPPCPLLALHETLTSIQTNLSDPLRSLHPQQGQESLHELEMREMTRAFNGMLCGAIRLVQENGTDGPEVFAVLEHAKVIVGDCSEQ
ncbi:hypothetical protein NliqN6_5774 [Naganishia liquefaciens]|uniref:Uncharacterized protein n=1 Tax=Naganishia liquefaciens TaxID=104408 RepID=A0A8H3TYD8_9TREE|nr:hypothetical protein NliqN6_5774 [Naganishia liquefaciens]